MSDTTLTSTSELLHTSIEHGLSTAEAATRLRVNGPNGLAVSSVRWYRILARQFRSPFIYLLFFAAAISLLLQEYADAGFIFLFVSVNSLLGFYQEYHSEKTVAMLQKLVHPRARVRRNGHEVVVDRRDIVPGDIVVVETGDILPADIQFLTANGLSIDESIITGESVSVNKVSAPVGSMGDDSKGVGGTHVVGGKAVGVVIATGLHSQLGDISTLTAKTVRVSAFEQGIYKFSTFILKLVISTLLLIFLLKVGMQWLFGGSIDISALVIFSIALAVSVIPEALPLVTTFSLSRGASMLAKKNVIVRRLSAIEDLGGIQILCTDKTGTITENALTVADTFIHEKNNIILDASLAAPFLTEATPQPSNSFDLALWNKLPAADKAFALKAKRIAEVPFDPDRRRNSVLVQSGKGGLIIVRGAPESVFTICSSLPKKVITQAMTWSKAQGLLGRRVIAIAKREVTKAHCNPEGLQEDHLDFVGLISFVDPLKTSAPKAITDAAALGVTVKIITGDSPDVAGAVGTQIGLIHDPGLVLTGEQLSALSESEKLVAVEKYNVFARVSPREKHAIITLLKQRYTVGFLGEGINDAPALKEAHVAITVDGAADVAREAADIILLQHDLSVVVEGIKNGREVFANTVKYIKATLASNFGNFYSVAAVSLLVDFLPMLPAQILLVNLLTDLPMMAIAADSVDEDELATPRSYDIKEVALLALILGTVGTMFDFVSFSIFFRYGTGVVQTMWFIGSILTELIFFFSIRTRRSWWRAKPPALIIIALSTIMAAITLVIPYTHLGETLFHFIKPSFPAISLIIILVVVYFIATELVKDFYYRFRRVNTSIK